MEGEKYWKPLVVMAVGRVGAVVVVGRVGREVEYGHCRQ